eukprot:g22878.t1
MGRLKTLEKRAAWAFLGVAGEGVASQARIKKAFKRRALELHPDKGGDADRFRLLQDGEMRDLLVEPKSHALEGGKEARKDKEGKKDEKKDNEDEEADEEEEEFSDDSWDADEEFRKMFPKRKKKKKQPEEAEAEIELRMRACRLSEEIQRSQTQSGAGDALRQLRKFVDRFAVTEVQKLRTDDPKKAQRIFRRFLEQGAEVLCAAGALDPAAAVSVVAMQVNCPLLQATEEDGVLQRKCQALLEAIQELPSIGEQVGSIPTDEGLAFELLLPDDDAVGRDAGQRTARRVLLQLPTDATLGCLRAAAQHCGGFDRVPRLFAKGRFVAGADSVPLSALQLGSLQCLPSNLTRRSQAPKPKPTAPAPTVPASAATPVAPVAPVAVSVETLKRVEPMVARDEQAEPAEQPIAGKPVEPENDENKENDDAWFDDFFAEKKEKREAHQKAQEQGKNAMQARLKAQKQALEAKKRQDAERHGSRPKAVTPSPKAVTPSARPEAKKPEPETRGQSEPDERKESRALVVSKDEPCLKLQKSRDSWEDSWSHPCAGAKRSDGSAIFCGPCDGRFEHEDFEMHCEKDHCLIIVGVGGKADEILAKRRLAAGGRLAHFMTQGPMDVRVTQQSVEDRGKKSRQPPPASMGISKFAQKLQGKPRTYWTKNGCSTGNGAGFSWRFVRLALAIQLLWQVAKLSLSISFEQDAVLGKIPWYRNLLSALNWTLTGQLVCTEMWSYSLTGEPASGQTHVVANLSATVGIMAVTYFQFSDAGSDRAFGGVAYNWLVHTKKVDGQGPLAGDQIYVAAPCLIMSAHGFAEACRLAATLAGAINSGGFAWVPTTCLGVALNLAARLGWSRFILMQLTKWFKGGPAAVAIFAPTGWSKYHDELKIYCGYYRFVLVLALVGVRAFTYQSATVEGDNADPAQLITLEYLNNIPENDPWKMFELEASGKRSQMSSLRRTSSKLSFGSIGASTNTARTVESFGRPTKSASLGTSDRYVWARLRRPVLAHEILTQSHRCQVLGTLLDEAEAKSKGKVREIAFPVSEAAAQLARLKAQEKRLLEEGEVSDAKIAELSAQVRKLEKNRKELLSVQGMSPPVRFFMDTVGTRRPPSERHVSRWRLARDT